MNRLISHTPPLSAETTKVRRRADQRRELMNEACDLPSPGLKVVAYRSGRLDVKLNNMGEADLVDQRTSLARCLRKVVLSRAFVQMSAHWSLVGTNSGEEMLSS